MRDQKSRRVAFCGVMAALMLTVMLLGTLVPLSTYLCPALAGALMIPAVWELGGGAGGLIYAAVSVLSLILAPDKEAALLYALLLGWYPILRPKLQHIRRRFLRVLWKLALFNAALLALYGLLLFVLVSPDLQEELAGQTHWMLAGMLLLGNVTFLIYDTLLARLTNLYVMRLRPRLFQTLR